MSSAVIGGPIKRLEDPALVQGRGTYLADVALPGMLHAAVLRSPYAHARIRSIDAAAASRLPGVVRIFTHADLGDAGGPVPLQLTHAKLEARMFGLLAAGEVRYVGEPVALVVAESRYLAEDALDPIAVDYEPLPAASDAVEALEPGAPPAHLDLPGNLAADFTASFGDVDAAFSRADLVLRERFKVHRGTAQAMETRGVLARYDARASELTIWSATQAPHLVRLMVSHILEMSEWQVRVIAPPDVGGGFGPKAMFYAEEGLIPFAARALGRPVRWSEDRREHLQCAIHERDQYHDAEIALTRDGHILGVRDSVVFDTGAYVPWGIVEPIISATGVPGPYKLAAYECRMRVAYTNRVAVAPIRGAGRPQAVFVMERLLDRAAAALGFDPADIRFRNLIQPEDMPYAMGLTGRDGSPVTYDSGDYPACLRTAMELIGYSSFGQEQERARREGRQIGVGLACYVENTGLGPFEGVTLQVDARGQVLVTTGAAPQGQGHWTMLAQIASATLGVPMEAVRVVTGDTGAIPYGVGTFASRTAVNAGNSVQLAASEVREQLLSIASSLLEASREDLDVEDGQVFVRGSRGRAVSVAEVARAAIGGLPGSTFASASPTPGLRSTQYFTPPQSAYASGAHAVKVEVDPETGDVRILDYAVAHDCGRIINPLIVDGQVQGGVAHGLGNAFYEEFVYDREGQPLTTTFMDYLLPTASEIPDTRVAHVEVTCPLNPLGVKGAGEGGTIPAPAAFANAVENALGADRVTVCEAPLSPAKLMFK